MNIFSQENFIGVAKIINKENGKMGNGQVMPVPKNETVKDEIAELNQQSQQIQELIGEIETLPDPGAKELMQQCMQEMLSFYGKGLKRILTIISNGNSNAAKDIYNAMVDDSFVSGLLLIHDLHPLDLKTRLYMALEKVKPYMDSHGGSVELVSLEGGVAKLKLSGSCKSCPSSSSTLELGIKQSVEELCPDLEGLEVEGVETGTTLPAKSSPKTGTGWNVIKGVSEITNGTFKHIGIPGTDLVISRVSNQLYAYRDHCPACDRPFNNGMLEGNVLSCQLGHRYDLQHAGVCTDDPGLHLDPFPLLEEAGGIVKVAV